jgi:hypothetical protein
MIVVMVRTIVIGLLAAFALAPAALAAPPTLVAVGQTGGHATASWTLPNGGQVWTIEVSKTATVDSDGYFLVDDVVDNDVFVDSRTSWTSDVVLDPGSYYLHVSGSDRNCSTCQILEWSTIRTLTVPATTAGTPTAGSTPATTAPGSTPTSGTTAPASGATPATPEQQPATAPTASAAPVVSGSGSVSGATAKLKGSVAQVGFRVCGSGNVDVKVIAQRGTRLLATVVTLPLVPGTCLAYRLGVTVPKGTGAATVSVDGTVLKL